MTAWNIAHRGGAGLAPENTLAAFGHAIAMGCDGAELDVQLSADGVVVVHHDYRLNPGYCRDASGDWLTGETPRIKDLTLAQLQAFDVGRPKPDSDYARAHPLLTPVDGARIPTLAQVVATATPSSFRLLVELKSSDDPVSADPVALADAALVVCEDYLDQIVFVGFDWRGLLRIKQRTSQAACWFSTDAMTGDISAIIDGIAESGANGWFPHFINATPQAVSHAQASGLKVGAWTVNDPVDLARLAGLDALCTDRPDLRLRNFPPA